MVLDKTLHITSVPASNTVLLAILVLRPQEIDEAARRRLVKRLYIPLPEAGARKQIMSNLLCQQNCSITDQEVSKIVKETDGMR